MLLRDFIFSFKNIHISFLIRRKIIKFFKVGVSILYKFFVLELVFYNFFYKKNLDKDAIVNKELFKRDLNFLFTHFNSLKIDHDYVNFYTKELAYLKEKKIDILEIGTAKGDGLASFYYYFPNSNLVGLDNNPFRMRYKSKRIRNIFADVSSRQVLKNLSNHLNQKFDLIIEDSSHKLIDQILCFVENFKNLKNGGIYVVEDLNFPEIHEIYNPTNEKKNLKTILKKIISGEEVVSKFIEKDEMNYIKENVKNIDFYKSKNKNNYLILGLCDYSEIAFIKKK
tara:strand:+ start:276 stop:1121 length:846 start_codon:yes stop_codon:yes gene_type:complete